MSSYIPDTKELRDIDQIGYEHYRYLLDLIYSKGMGNKDHYKLKDQVDKYIVQLIHQHDNQLRTKLLEALHTDFPEVGVTQSQIDYARGYNTSTKDAKQAISAVLGAARPNQEPK